jgi:hypothetical protein
VILSAVRRCQWSVPCCTFTEHDCSQGLIAAHCAGGPARVLCIHLSLLCLLLSNHLSLFCTGYMGRRYGSPRRVQYIALTSIQFRSPGHGSEVSTGCPFSSSLTVCLLVCDHFQRLHRCAVAAPLGSSGTESPEYVSTVGPSRPLQVIEVLLSRVCQKGNPSPRRLRCPRPSAHVNSCGQSQSMPVRGYASTDHRLGPLTV